MISKEKNLVISFEEIIVKNLSKNGQKIFKIFLITAILIGFAIDFNNQFKGYKASLLEYKKSSFSGVIKDTVHYPMKNDLPTYIFTNGSSHFYSFNEFYIQGKIKVEDSLSKVSGEDTMRVFRKQASGQYIQIYPR